MIKIRGSGADKPPEELPKQLTITKWETLKDGGYQFEGKDADGVVYQVTSTSYVTRGIIVSNFLRRGWYKTEDVIGAVFVIERQQHRGHNWWFYTLPPLPRPAPQPQPRQPWYSTIFRKIGAKQ